MGNTKDIFKKHWKLATGKDADETTLSHMKWVLDAMDENTIQELISLETNPPEDTDNVLFYRVPISEPPYCGSLLDLDFRDDYYTHWTQLPKINYHH